MMRPIFPYKLQLTDTQVSRIFKAFCKWFISWYKIQLSKFKIQSKYQLSKMLQLGGLIESISGTYLFFLTLGRAIIKDEDKIIAGLNKGLSLGLTKKVLERITGSGVTLTNNEIKDIAKVIRSLEIRGISLQGTTKTLLVKREGFSILGIINDSWFTINVITPLAKSVWVPLSLIAAASATDAAIQNKYFGLETTALIISNEEMKIT